MTPLGDIIKRKIAASGPISVAEYMHDCLLHPKHGYYTTRDPFGQTGDFTTAPEISQMFGELIGIWLAQCWIDQGRPTPFTLAEPGPGRGTLMADILRACKKVPGFVQSANLVLIEASPVLRDIQRATLAPYDVNWVDSIADLPDAPLFLVANEFFDALPVRPFTRHENGWQEHQISVVDDTLIMGLSGSAPIAGLDHRLDDTRPGDVVETCAPGAAIVSHIAGIIATSGGVALIIDYGGWRSLGDTFQALRQHEMESPLAHPGEADLTAHVDFQALSNAAIGVTCTAMTPQGVFLERLGITERARKIARTLSGEALNSHILAHRRLTHGDEMGSLFKTIALCPVGAPALAGFEP